MESAELHAADHHRAGFVIEADLQGFLAVCDIPIYVVSLNVSRFVEDKGGGPSGVPPP
jgi:hypothetical protein